MSTKQVAVHPQAAATPGELLRIAVEQNADLDKLEKLMDLQQRYEADQARKAYVAAMTAFKANPPRVQKSKTVKFSGTSYTHATLADACDAAVGELAKHGLSHRWSVTQKDDGITVACIITHEQGHSESVQMTAPADKSGSKNGIQAIASTVTYLERYTLMGMLGLASYDMDDDGRAAGEDDPEREKREAEEKAKAELLADLTDKVSAAPTLDDLKALAPDIAKAKFSPAMRHEIGAVYKGRQSELKKKGE